MSDSISRQAAIRWVKTECNPYGKPTLDFESGKKVIEHLEQMPSADRPQGHWTKTDAATYRCSECGKIQIADDVNELNFCCCCGSRNKMRR